MATARLQLVTPDSKHGGSAAATSQCCYLCHKCCTVMMPAFTTQQPRQNLQAHMHAVAFSCHCCVTWLLLPALLARPPVLAAAAGLQQKQTWAIAVLAAQLGAADTNTVPASSSAAAAAAAFSSAVVLLPLASLMHCLCCWLLQCCQGPAQKLLLFPAEVQQHHVSGAA